MYFFFYYDIPVFWELKQNLGLSLEFPQDRAAGLIKGWSKIVLSFVEFCRTFCKSLASLTWKKSWVYVYSNHTEILYVKIHRLLLSVFLDCYSKCHDSGWSGATERLTAGRSDSWQRTKIRSLCFYYCFFSKQNLAPFIASWCFMWSQWGLALEGPNT